MVTSRSRLKSVLSVAENVVSVPLTSERMAAVPMVENVWNVTRVTSVPTGSESPL